MCKLVLPWLIECGQVLTLTIVLCVLPCQHGYGDDKKWDAGGTDNKWSTDENWDDDDTPPGTSSDVVLEATFSVSVDVELDQSATIHSFLVSGPTVYALSEVEQTGGDLTITSTVHDAVIGSGVGEDGQYTLTDGTFETTGGCFCVGAEGGTGWFFQDGGEVIVAEGNRFAVGQNGVGEYEMTGGTLDASYRQIGNGSTSDEGTFTQVGATTDVEFHKDRRTRPHHTRLVDLHKSRRLARRIVRLFTTTRQPPTLKSNRRIGRGARSPFERPQPRPKWYAASISASAMRPQNGKCDPRPTSIHGSFFVA